MNFGFPSIPSGFYSTFTCTDLFANARSPIVSKLAEIDIDSPSFTEHPIDINTLKQVFKAVEIFGLTKVADLCRAKVSGSAEIASDASVWDWINQLNNDDLQKIENCILALKNKEGEILSVFKPSENRHKKVLVAELDHFIGDESYRLMSKNGALFLQKYGEMVDPLDEKNCVMTAGQLFSVFQGSLCNLNLANLDLINVNLSNANFYGSNLRGTNFSNSNLRNANLNNTDMYMASLCNSDCSYAKLRYANLSKAVLDQTKFISANVFSANLTGTSLNGDFSGADFTQVKGLSIAGLRSAKFSAGTTFIGVHFCSDFTENCDKERLQQFFNASGNADSASVLTAIDSMHRTVKMNAFRTLVESLENADVSTVAGNFREFLDKNPTLKNNEIISRFIERKKIYQ